jgi:nicotinamidase-related amidase
MTEERQRRYRSAFQNTDLNYQLRQRDITKVVVAGMIANHCIEATARYAFDLYVFHVRCFRAEIG